jgi:ketosteroid isomerase-like protein
MDTEQLTARVREAYEAFDRHDGGPLLAALSEDIEWWDPLPGDYPIGGRRRPGAARLSGKGRRPRRQRGRAGRRR